MLGLCLKDGWRPGVWELQKGTKKKLICTTALTPDEMFKDIWMRSKFLEDRKSSQKSSEQKTNEETCMMYSAVTYLLHAIQQEKPQCGEG